MAGTSTFSGSNRRDNLLKDHRWATPICRQGGKCWAFICRTLHFASHDIASSQHFSAAIELLLSMWGWQGRISHRSYECFQVSAVRCSEFLVWMLCIPTSELLCLIRIR